MFRFVVLPCFDLGLTVPMYMYMYLQLYMLGAKFEFAQSTDCTVQSTALHFTRTILGLPTACTIPVLRKQCCGGHNYKY